MFQFGFSSSPGRPCQVPFAFCSKYDILSLWVLHRAPRPASPQDALTVMECDSPSEVRGALLSLRSVVPQCLSMNLCQPGDMSSPVVSKCKKIKMTVLALVCNIFITSYSSNFQPAHGGSHPGAPQVILRHGKPDYLVRHTGLFSLRLSN